MKCLIVEDDKSLCHLLARVLRRLGHDVEIALSLSAARDALCAKPFDTLLIDFSLPDGTALDLLKIARCADPAPRILVMTGSPDFPMGAAAARAMGVSDILMKPFENNALARALAQTQAAA
ncbi:MAG: response regulator [Pseudomonadota bacterium]